MHGVAPRFSRAALDPTGFNAHDRDLVTPAGCAPVIDRQKTTGSNASKNPSLLPPTTVPSTPATPAGRPAGRRDARSAADLPGLRRDPPVTARRAMAQR